MRMPGLSSNWGLHTVFVFGLAIGAASVVFAARQRRRRYVHETTEQMKRSGEIQDRLYAMMVMVHRSALAKIEAGDEVGAKRELSDSIANFYQIQTEGRRELALVGLGGMLHKEPEDYIGQELRAIEQDARRFESLRTALARKQNEPPA